jgi:hypothetical protein
MPDQCRAKFEPDAHPAVTHTCNREPHQGNVHTCRCGRIWEETTTDDK